MKRVLPAGLLAIAVLSAGSVSLIAWSTRPEQPGVAPEPSGDHTALAVVAESPPQGPIATPDRPAAESFAASPQATAAPPPRVPPALSTIAAGLAPGEATTLARLDDSPRRRDGKRMPGRVVYTARDRHLRVAHPELLAR